jgi:hypothetical protein
VHGTFAAGLRIEWRPLHELASYAVQWRELAARAIEPNVFYEPSFALAAAPVLGEGVGAVMVWSGLVPARLLGFFPARIERRRYGIAALPVLVGWIHPYGPLGTPLVDAENAATVLRAWLDFVVSEPQIPKLLLMPFLPVAGRFATALTQALGERRTAFFGRQERALLMPAAGRADYLVRAISKKKRKEIHRQTTASLRAATCAW